MINKIAPKQKKIISIIILIIIIFLFAYYIYSNKNDFKTIKVINIVWLIPVVIIFFLVSYLNGLVIKFQQQPFNIHLKFKEWFGLSIITTFYNTITPFRGGLLAKATYLKQKHKFSYINSLATVSGIYVVNFFVASLIGLIALFFIYEKYGTFNIIVTLIFLAFFIPTLFLILFSPKFPETKYKSINYFTHVANGWHTLRKEHRIVFYLTLITLSQLLLNSIMQIIAYDIFGIQISFIKALFLVALASLAILLAITPAGLGITEAVAVFSALVIGITPEQSLPVAILIRVVGVIYIFILGPIFSYVLLKEHDKKYHTK